MLISWNYSARFTVMRHINLIDYIKMIDLTNDSYTLNLPCGFVPFHYNANFQYFRTKEVGVVPWTLIQGNTDNNSVSITITFEQ